MALDYSQYELQNGESAGVIRNNLNAYNSQVAVAVNTLTTNTNNNTANISTNTDALNDLIGTDIPNLDWRIKDLEDFPKFVYDQFNGLITGDTYETLIDISNAVANGTYVLNMSMFFQLNNTNTSSFFRFSLDNGNTWTEVSVEAKDVNNTNTLCYAKPIAVTNGAVLLKIQGRKEQASDVLNVLELNAMFTRVA
jgi:hypothetical protein